MKPTPVPFVDLKPQHEEIADELARAFASIMDRAAFFFTRERLRWARRSMGLSFRAMAYFFLPSLRRMYSPA